LALVAGLAAQFTPAQARGGAAVGVEIGAVASAAVGQRQAALRSALPVPGRRAARLDERPGPVAHATAPVFAPVRPGIDRARE
jgi:hypothetical protein